MTFYFYDAFQLAFVIVSMIFNVLFVTVLLRFKKDFSGEFFQLCVSQAFADFGQLFFGLFTFKFPNYGWYLDDLVLVSAKKWLPGLLMCVSWLFTTTQLIGMVNLAANRFTALAMPTKYTTVSVSRQLILVQ
jgi:hypothetical protein